MAEPLRTPYGGYDVLDKWDSPSWDDFTREVVRRRLEEVPGRRFLTAEEWETLDAVCARLIPQDDRGDRPVPIVPFIDQRLHDDRGDGYRYADMPEMREAWRLGVAGIERQAAERHGERFTQLSAPTQEEILLQVQRGRVAGGPWDTLPPQRFFTDVLLRTVVGIYYAHPAAWSEVGFGGPASPRGYVRRELGSRDSWEAAEAWNPVRGAGGAP